ncbi:MAG: pilin [Rhodocyclaceae bacterium]|nr:pilin [Rhodocyclaceae bacterium]
MIKGQVAGALAESSAGKIGFSTAVMDGKTPSLTSTDDGFIGIQAATTYCGNAVTATTIVCTATNGHATNFNGKTITHTYATATGIWVCTTTLDAKYKPKNCT